MRYKIIIRITIATPVKHAAMATIFPCDNPGSVSDVSVKNMI